MEQHQSIALSIHINFLYLCSCFTYDESLRDFYADSEWLNLYGWVRSNKEGIVQHLQSNNSIKKTGGEPFWAYSYFLNWHMFPSFYLCFVSNKVDTKDELDLLNLLFYL